MPRKDFGLVRQGQEALPDPLEQESVIPGGRVQVGVSPYDPTHGFITFRLREGEAPPS